LGDIDLTQWVVGQLNQTNFKLILKNKINRSLKNLRRMKCLSTQDGLRTCYSLQQATSDDCFFKLNNLKSTGDTDIEIDPTTWDLCINLRWIQSYYNNYSEPIESQIEIWSVNMAEPHRHQTYQKHQRLLPLTRSTYAPSPFWVNQNGKNGKNFNSIYIIFISLAFYFL
jgi:hypothetical protein